MTRDQIKAAPMQVHAMFPQPDDVTRLWMWLQAHPELNFDDSGPKDFQSFYGYLRLEYERGVEYFIVDVDGLGTVGVYAIKLEGFKAHFHGLCFADYVHRTGIATKAVRGTLRELFEKRGCRKVIATIFAANGRARAFFNGLGFASEGYFRNETIQNGMPVNVERLALHFGKLREV